MTVREIYEQKIREGHSVEDATKIAERESGQKLTEADPKFNPAPGTVFDVDQRRNSPVPNSNPNAAPIDRTKK